MRAHRMAVFGCTALLAYWRSSMRRLATTTPAEGTARPPPAVATPTRVILGTTDKVVALDPVGAYDLGSQQLIGNIYQNLLSVPAGGNKPEPDAAESCEFSDTKTYVCKLKPDLKFSSGDPLTSEDVKFSLDRMVKIEDPTGPYTLLGSLDSVEATDPTTVTMKLKQGRRDVARSSSPTTSRRSSRTRSIRPTPSSSRRQGDRLGPVQARQVHAEPAGGASRPTRELHRREQGADAELHRPVLRAGLGAEAGDRAG